MGRWAQARRRGSASNAAGVVPLPIGVVLTGDIFSVTIELNWGSLGGNPTTGWDLELYNVTFGSTLIESDSIAGALRVFDFTTPFAAFQQYNARIRGNNGGGQVSAWVTSNTIG